MKIESITSGVELGKNVWIPPQYRKLSTKTLDITKHALTMWDKIHDRDQWGYNSPLIPLKDTDYFLPGREDLFGRWILKDEVQLKDIMRQGKMCTYQELKAKDNWFTMDIWKYRQLKHFVDSLPRPIRSMKDLRPLEKALLEKKGRGGVSRIYRILIKLGEVECPTFFKKWEEELGNKISEREVGLVLERVNATSVNYRLSEMNFRILARMYITPDRAHKLQKEPSQLCWRGITSMRVPDDPWVCLHHGSNMPSKRYLKLLLPHLLNAAKSLIPRHVR